MGIRFFGNIWLLRYPTLRKAMAQSFVNVMVKDVAMGRVINHDIDNGHLSYILGKRLGSFSITETFDIIGHLLTRGWCRVTGRRDREQADNGNMIF